MDFLFYYQSKIPQKQKSSLTQPFGPHPLRFRMNLAFVKQGNNSSLFLARILGPFPVVVKIQLAKN